MLARVYEAWDALDFTKAYSDIKVLNKELERDRMLNSSFLLMDKFYDLKKQEDILKALAQIPILLSEKRNIDILTQKEIMTALMFTMFQNAFCRERQEKYDMSTLLFYRLLEMIEQRRLAHYGLYVSKMDYANIAYNYSRTPEFDLTDTKAKIDLLKKKVLSIKQELFKKNTSDYLPEQVSLLEGFILLTALEDEVMYAFENPINKLKRIRSMVFLRNNSIFAHGLGPVGEKDFIKFKSFVIEVFIEYCAVEDISFDDYVKDISWINPVDSSNYYNALTVD